MILLFSDDTWYITRDVYSESGEIRSLQKDDFFLPKEGWEFFDQRYYDNNFDNCKTRLENIDNLEKYSLIFSHF